jgi:hypothetical protein
LEEENEHINQDLKKLTAEHKRLQESYDSLKKQLSTPAPPPVVSFYFNPLTLNLCNGFALL